MLGAISTAFISLESDINDRIAFSSSGLAVSEMTEDSGKFPAIQKNFAQYQQQLVLTLHFRSRGLRC